MQCRRSKGGNQACDSAKLSECVSASTCQQVFRRFHFVNPKIPRAVRPRIRVQEANMQEEIEVLPTPLSFDVET